MEQTLTIVTTVFLLVGWAAMELLTHRCALRATVVRAIEPKLPLQEMIATDLLVRLDDGREVIARASGCVSCQGRFTPGSAVLLLKQKDGFVISLPWLNKRKMTCGVAQ